jgi:hypothetical protein
MPPMTVERRYDVKDLTATRDFDDEVKRATAAFAADRCSNPMRDVSAARVPTSISDATVERVHRPLPDPPPLPGRSPW